MNKHLKDERDICCGVVSTPETGGSREDPGPVHPAGAGALVRPPQPHRRICLTGSVCVSRLTNQPRSSLRKKQKQRAGLGDVFDDADQPPKRCPACLLDINHLSDDDQRRKRRGLLILSACKRH